MPLDMSARMSRRRLLLASAGVAGAALVGRFVPGLDALASGTVPGGPVPGDGAGQSERVAGAAPGGGVDGSRLCLGVALFEATQHGDETLVLPAVDRWRELTGFYPAILPLWSPFDLELPAPRGGIFPADWLLQGLRERGVEPAVFAHSADEVRWRTHGYEAILRGAARRGAGGLGDRRGGLRPPAHPALGPGDERQVPLVGPAGPRVRGRLPARQRPHPPRRRSPQRRAALLPRAAHGEARP